MAQSKIEWTNKTWNPITGCSKVSAGCEHCYAIRQAFRLDAMGQKDYSGVVSRPPSILPPKEGGVIIKPRLNWTGKINLLEHKLDYPLRIKKPTMFFVNSMSDLFHEDVPFDFIDKVFAVMALTWQHTYQILTKRPERVLEYFKYLGDIKTISDRLSATLYVGDWFMYDTDECDCIICNRIEGELAANCLPGWPLKNVWIGVSVEDQESADKRIPLLVQVPAAVRWLSCEPLLGPVDIKKYLAFPATVTMHEKPTKDLQDAMIEMIKKAGCKLDINWVVCGGESGPGARPMHPDWARKLRDDCINAGVSFFFKQWGEWCSLGQMSKVKSEKAKTEKLNGLTLYRVGKHESGRNLDGMVWNQWPEEKK